MKSLPHVFHIGPMRTGSTWLQMCLRQHPEIKLLHGRDDGSRFFYDKNEMFMQGRKDKILYSFDNSFEDNKDNIKSYYKAMEITNIDKVKAIFRGTRCHKVVHSSEKLMSYGDFYLMSRIAPDAKIIVILREPTERLLSHINWESARNTEIKDKNLYLKEVFETKGEALKMGFYKDSIEKIEQYFEKHQIYIFNYDDLERNPKNFLNYILKCIGVSERFHPSRLNYQINTSNGHQTINIKGFAAKELHNKNKFKDFDIDLVEMIHKYYLSKNEGLEKLISFKTQK